MTTPRRSRLHRQGGTLSGEGGRPAPSDSDAAAGLGAQPAEEARTRPIPGMGQVARRAIPDTHAGIRAEIARMGVFVRDGSADPLVRQTAEHVLYLCGGPELTDAQKKDCSILNLFQWVKANFNFIPDPIERELIKTPAKMLRQLHAAPQVIAAILGPLLADAVQGRARVEMMPAQFDRLNVQPRASRILVVDGPRAGETIQAYMTDDCDGAVTLAALLASVGVWPRWALGGVLEEQTGECRPFHVWVQAESSTGEWVDLDVTHPDSTPGWVWPHFTCLETRDIYENAE